jgi:hypothetical protein
MIRAIDVSDLPQPMADAIEALVQTYRAQIRHTTESAPPRPIGWLKGQWELPESFFDPLPEDLLNSFEGDNLP